MNEQKNNFSLKEKIFHFLCVVSIIILTCFSTIFGFVSNTYLREYENKQVENISNLDTEKKCFNKKLSQTEHSISVGTYNAFVGTMGTVNPYSVFANAYITLDFEKNEETLGDYHFAYIELKNIQLNVIFYRYNHNNFEVEYIGQIANSYSVTAQDFNASVDYWFNLVEYLEVNISFENIDYGSSNEFEFYIDFYAHDTQGEEIVYTFYRTNQFQYTNPFNITYVSSIVFDNYLMPWIELFISQEVYDYWYEKGYSEGKSDGYSEGYIDGEIIGGGGGYTNVAFRYIWASITNATNAVLNVFDFEILPDIPLYAVIAVPIIISVLFYILKVIKK